MNATLEVIARAIFKSWFVDFDPVHAKASGERPFGMDANTAALFSDSLKESELGLIPAGWRISEIGQEVETVGGSTPNTKNPAFWEDGNIYWTTPKNLSSLSSPVLLDTDRKITEAGLTKISSGLLPVGTVLMSSRAPVGYLAIAEIPVAINQGYIAMICNKLLSNCYVLFWCEANMDTIKGLSGGTTFSEISKRNFRPIEVIVPPYDVIEAFDRVVDPLYQKLVLNLREAQTLAELRDTLLPKLISGELRVGEIEDASTF
jgi:type I restriction enzyme S subunit